MTYSLENKHVLIVGGSSDIAAALAADLLREGARVTLAGRDFEKTAVSAKAVGDTVRPVALDLSDEESVQAAADQARAGSGLDHLVSVATERANGPVVSTERRALLVNPFITGETLHVDGGAGPDPALDHIRHDRRKKHIMSSISIIGLGNMARTIGARAVASGHAQAKASVAALITSLGLRPLDTGPLEMARWLEGTGLVMMGLGRHGVGNFTFTLGVDTSA